MESLSSELVSDIKHKIESGDLIKGQKLLSERKLAEKYAVSRTVVREAISILRVKGLVNVQIGKGAFITKPDPIIVTETIKRIMQNYNTTIEDVLEVREELERSIIKKSVQFATAGDIQELYQLHEKMKGYRSNLNKYIELDVQFHLTIAKSTKNPIFHILLQSFIEITQNVLFTLMRLLNKQANLSQEQHLALIKALESRDEQQALTIISAHMQVIRDEIIELRKNKLI